jgi:AAA+ ATPase superfamily predicted ATPase
MRTPENGKLPISNPYDYTHPVTKDRFYGRQCELERLTSVILAGKSVVIYGLQRMGKTSLVEEALELAKDQIASRFVVLPIDMFISYANLNSYFDLFVTILDALWEKLEGTDYSAYKDAQRHYFKRHSELAELQRGFIDLLAQAKKGSVPFIWERV